MTDRYLVLIKQSFVFHKKSILLEPCSFADGMFLNGPYVQFIDTCIMVNAFNKSFHIWKSNALTYK